MLPSYIKINSTEKNLIVITCDYKIDGVYFFLKEFYPLLLQEVFSGKKIEIITLNPNQDALCYDLGNYKEVEFNQDKAFVNIIDIATFDILTQITSSFEFEMGALAIVSPDTHSLEQRVETVYKYFNEDIENANESLLHTFCYCEPDGYIIYFVNTSLKESTITEIAIKAEASI